MNNPGSKTAVIIPCAGEAVASETVRAALAQAGGHRVILAGAAPGGLPDDARLTVIDTGAPVPPGKARNLGAQAAAGAQILIFLDADCVPRPGWLENLAAALSGEPELVGGVLRPAGEGYFFFADQVTSFYDQLEGSPGGWAETLTATNLALTRDLWEKAGPFPEDVFAGEDLEFVLCCRRAGAKPFLVPDAVVEHRPGPTDLRRMVRHAAGWGAQSIHVRGRFADLLPVPFWMRSPLALALLAPAVGAAFALRQIRSAPPAFRKLRWWPAMALAKTAWCLAAAKSLFAQ